MHVCRLPSHRSSESELAHAPPKGSLHVEADVRISAMHSHACSDCCDRCFCICGVRLDNSPLQWLPLMLSNEYDTAARTSVPNADNHTNRQTDRQSIRQAREQPDRPTDDRVARARFATPRMGGMAVENSAWLGDHDRRSE